MVQTVRFAHWDGLKPPPLNQTLVGGKKFKIEKFMIEDEVNVVKDEENELPIPTAWRPVFSEFF